MNRLRRYVPPFLILVILASLVVGFRSFLVTHIITPVVLLFWAAWRVVISVDQNIYWTLLIVFCAILAFRLIPARNGKSPDSAYNHRYRRLDRVEYWQRLMLDAAFDVKEWANLRDELQKLHIDSTTEAERLDSTVLGEINLKEKDSLSPKAQCYLYSQRGELGKAPKKHQLNFMFLAPKWLRKRTRRYLNQDDTMIDEILRKIETELEINYEK